MISNASDSCKRLSRRPVTSARLAALSMLSFALAFGCGNANDTGTSGTNGNGNGTGATNGGGATGGNGAAPFSGAVLCTLASGPNGFSGFIRLVSDEELESDEEIDSLEGAIEIGGAASCTVQGRSVFVLSGESPIITRYDEVDGALVDAGTVSFANFGLGSLASFEQTVLLSETKAYYADPLFSQIIVWNPSAMETIGSIPLANSAEGLQQLRMRINLIDDLVVVYVNNRNEQGIMVARTDFWFVDPATDTVVATDTTQQCGDLLAVIATATSGDVYIGSNIGAAMEHVLGLPGSFPPCAIRIRPGAREVDPMYLADLNALTGGLPAASPFPVGPDRAFLLAYNTDEVPIDPMLTVSELLSLENWDLYEWELGSEQPVTLVEGLPTSAARIGTIEFDGRTFLVRVAPDLSSTELVDLTERVGETVFTFTNGTLRLVRLGSEAGPRMAQRTEHGGGAGVFR